MYARILIFVTIAIGLGSMLNLTNAYAGTRTVVMPNHVQMEFTLALCKGKPVGFWEYDYTMFSMDSDLNFRYSLKINESTYRVTRGVYEFYKSHPKALAASLFARGEASLYDLVQVNVPDIANPRWHHWYPVSLNGHSGVSSVSTHHKHHSSDSGSQTCPAGTVTCSLG